MSERLKLIEKANEFRKTALDGLSLCYSDLDDSSIDIQDCTVRIKDISVHFFLIKPSAKKNTPFVVNLHGGGMVLGHTDRDILFCKRISVETGFAVISLDYHLSPEYVYPYAYNETVLLVQYLLDHAEDYGLLRKYVFVGESSGGTLAFCAANYFANSSCGAEGVVCCYSVFDYVTDPELKLQDSTRTKKELYSFFRNCYFESIAENTKQSSPLFFEVKKLANIKHIMFVEPENDELKSENIKMYQLSVQAEVDSEIYIYLDSGHAFLVNQKGRWRQATSDIAMMILKWLS